MDLKIIEHNIRNDKYAGEEGMIEDMKLMFRNARHYNEEGSQVRMCGNPGVGTFSFDLERPGLEA